MGAWYEPEWKLAGLLETIIQNYEDDREKYWGDDDKAVRLIKFVDGWATKIVEASDDLVLTQDSPDPRFDWQSTQAIIRALELSSEVREKVEILLAWRFAGTTDQMAERCLELVAVFLSRRPSERVVRFMRRLGRCYIAGFFPEAIMVSRGVLENSVDEAIARRSIKTDGKMRSKLDALVENQALTEDTKAKAWIVWTRGSAAVHKDPEAVGQPLETIEMVMSVLTELQDES